MQTPAEILSEKGPLAQHVNGFAPRSQQQAMAEAVAQTLEDGGMLVAEAGTGTGKTFAYLVPALLSGRKVIISTGTKNLQDQLFHRDLPVVRRALEIPVTVALLKGRANYLCLHRLELNASEGWFRSGVQLDKLRQIQTWKGQTQSGDIAELSAIPENDPIWSYATSTTDNCLGQECPCFNDCYLTRARRQAQAADVVVINHYLLFADMMLREDGFGELLPAADAFIIDEAHQLPETASNFFGISLSSNQLRGLARDATAEYMKEINETNELANCCDALQKAVADLRLALGGEIQRAPWRAIEQSVSTKQAIADVTQQLSALQTLLKPLAERSKGLESCFKRGCIIQQSFDMLTQDAPDDHIHWYETHRRTFTLHFTPLNIAEYFHKHVYDISGAWVFTSATLAVGDSFSHYVSRLGLEDAETRRWESPFDYQHQALCYIPEGIPQPNSRNHTSAVIKTASVLLETSRGRAFLLFTSYRALNEAADALRDSLTYPLLVQGDAPRDTLLEEFRSLGNAVLLGTSSFWEGVDVRGEALSLVLIDKLPFASPGDPVLQARIDALREQGANPFWEYQVPNAVISLKQGVGRLIRDTSDRGVLVICDPRLYTKSYGRIFLESLPPMPCTRSLQEVEEFFATGDQMKAVESQRATVK